jgi:O-antigen ligase
LALVILIVPQLNNPELMNSTQSSKAFGFIGAMLGYTAMALIISIIKQRIPTIKITIVDILLGLYCMMVLTSYWLHPIDYLQMMTFGALILFYLSIRFLNPRYYIVLLFAVILSGLIQAIYGNLQLYGVFPSNHGLFKMTGSFFNPGPYAGYLAAIFPVALGLYLFRNPVNISTHDTFGIRIIFIYNKITNFFYRIPIISRFFYNTHTGVNTPEEQAHRISHMLDTIIHSFLLIAIMAMCLVLPASRSRAAWLAVMVSIGYLFAVKYDLLSIIRSTFNTIKKRILLLSSVIIILSITGAGMYYFKKGSADGRLLIWKVSSEMIKEKPILGHGAGKFEANYMNYQAAYFKPNPEVPEAIYADNVMYAYNELLKITIEHGLVCLLLALALIWSLFFVRIDSGEDKRSSLSIPAVRGSMLSVLVFALFSYPSDILPIQMIYVLFMAIVSGHEYPIRLFQWGKKETSPLPSNKVPLAGTVFLYTVLAVALIADYPAGKYLSRQYHAYQSWKDASDVYNVGAYPECLEDFELAYPYLKNNGQFLVQYGKAFEMAGKYENSINILYQAKGHLNNTILYTCLGNNYKTLGKQTEAEHAYLHAWNMAPARFYSLYLLAKLYDETGQTEKAVAIAKRVMEKDVKVESTAVEEIKEEMQQIITQYASLQNSN